VVFSVGLFQAIGATSRAVVRVLRATNTGGIKQPAVQLNAYTSTNPPFVGTEIMPIRGTEKQGSSTLAKLRARKNDRKPNEIP
jgi:hypothetical protein